MDVFVTGGTGFVGSHVVEQLLERGHRPLCLVRETSDTEHLDALGVETFVGTLDAVEKMRPAIEQVEAVVHVAGVTKVCTFDEFFRYNAEATAELARLCVDANPDLERFVFMSSVGAQGPAEADEPRPAEAEPEPVSHYGESKREAEKYLLELSDEFNVTIFRPPPVYGPRDTDMFDVFKMARFGLAPVYG
ncbi:MAG: NAD-dependent epimerase/dehydratase family protein, partial [Persicimonas sp.]